MEYSLQFEPTPDAARARLAAVQPAAYARTRNHLDGAVTRLSPYLTHGFLSIADVLQAAGPLPPGHRLVAELGWRAYFRHVWSHRGDAILASRHPGPLPDEAYARRLPDDLREGRTGVPAIDRAVGELYGTGWLHNHARMWLASYTVHLRKIHWRTGAEWMLAHLLDGDLASNHLSWQWVAGTASARPYLFNAENVARWAPSAWHSAGSVIDTSYEALEALARHTHPVPAGPATGGIAEPPVHVRPPSWLEAGPPDPAAVQGRPVWLVHPWHLADPPAGLAPGTQVVALLVDEAHAGRPWSAARWAFVGRRLAALAPHRWVGPVAAIRAALAGAAAVRGVFDPHLPAALRPLAAWADPPAGFGAVDPCCRSFSQWWRRVSGPLPQEA